MKRWLTLVALLASSSVHAEAASEEASEATIASYVEIANNACLPVASGAVTFANTSSQGDQETLAGFGVEYGIPSGTLERFGRKSEGILNRSVMGHRAIGDDLIVLSVGGAVPGCKVILLRPSDDGIADSVSTEITNSTPGWKALPFAKSRPGSSVSKRSFISRSSNGDPYLLNLISPPALDSEIRFLVTINRIPPHVSIPEGF